VSAVSINVNGDLRDALRKGEYTWGDIYRGTEQQLVAAGLVQSEWLPGRAERGKTVQRVVVSAQGARFPGRCKLRERVGWTDGGEAILTISRAGKRAFEVMAPCSREEEERRDAKQRREMDEHMLREALKRADARESEPRNEQAWDPTAFRCDLAMILNMGGAMLMRAATGNACFASRDIPAHKLSDDDVERIKAKLAEAQMILDNAKVEPINHAAAVRRAALTLVKG
jgi:hypothetical protein